MSGQCASAMLTNLALSYFPCAGYLVCRGGLLHYQVARWRRALVLEECCTY
jgi:hypothetical protein